MQKTVSLKGKASVQYERSLDYASTSCVTGFLVFS